MTTIKVRSTTIDLEALETGVQEALEGFKTRFPQEESVYLWASIWMALRVEVFRSHPTIYTYSRVKRFHKALLDGDLEAVKTYAKGE